MKEHVARKRFGQNFLHDANIIRRIAEAINPLIDDHMVEIGPGQGALTEPLLKHLSHLHAIELDRDLIPILQERFAGQGLEIHEADALKFDFRTLFSDNTPHEKPLRIVGNLPYNISTPLLFHLLEYHDQIQDMHFMLQLEVVDRLSAKPGNKDYGRLSVITQFYCQVDKLFAVPPGAFNPPPKVMSAIVRLAPRPCPWPVCDTTLFEKMVKAAFAQRRKTLRNNLKAILAPDQLGQLDIDLGLRPEQLNLQDYANLANQVSKLGGLPVNS